jgi:ATP-binding cassette subfamily C (CFTR/MRP) protein 1
LSAPLHEPPAANPAWAVELEHVSFEWLGQHDDDRARADADAGAPAGAPVDGSAGGVRDVNLRCAPGSFTLVVGPVGAGKSTLLSGLICEATRTHGMARVAGSVAYAGQSPWVLNRTLRENVVFVARFRADWYAAVMHACALDVDAGVLSHGDDTLIGDAGVTLSGGQRARVALARAVYADADVYLLDDVLSAVDAHVGAHIWAHCVVALLVRRGKTVVCATHALQYAARPEVTQVLLLDAGRVAASGAPAEVAGTYPPLAAAMTAVAAMPAPAEPSPAPAPVGAGAPGVARLPDPPRPPLAGRHSALAAHDQEVREQAARGTVKARDVWVYLRAMGPVPMLLLLLAMYVATQALTITITWWLTQWVQGSAGGVGGAAVAVAVAGGGYAGGAQPTSQPLAWHAVGAPAPAAPTLAAGGLLTSLTGLQADSPQYYAAVYGALNGGLALLSLLRMGLLSLGSLRAGTRLHGDALHGVLAAPARFFAENSAGRIANRFVSDVAIMDNQLRYDLTSLATQAFTLVAVLAVLSFTTPWVLLWVALLAGLYVRLGNRYRIAARDLRRIESTTKSPIMAHFAEALRGAAVIRAFGPGAAVAVVRRHLALCRDNTRASLAYMAANEYISVWLEVVGALVILAACVVAVAQHRAGGLATADVGFAMSYVLQIPSVLMWLVRFFTAVETDAVSLERILEYARLAGEDEAHAAVLAAAAASGEAADEGGLGAAGERGTGGDARPAPMNAVPPVLAPPPVSSGASRGGGGADVDIDGVWLRYTPHLPWVLQGLALRVPAGAKVAIVGRTGAGKSSFLQALLRMYPYERGAIRVSGRELQSLPASASRRMVTPLLQDGWLFSGTVRENLLGPRAAASPAGSTSSNGASAGTSGRTGGADAAVWAALRAAGLEAAVVRLRQGLEEPLSEHGGNVSAGERALICLARALLHRCESGGLSGGARYGADAAALPDRTGGGGGLVVCDEPTAQVDVAADAAVHDTLLGLPDTLLCICHRLTYVPRFDLVAVIENGRCVEVGPPAQLLAAGPGGSVFAALAAAVR